MFLPAELERGTKALQFDVVVRLLIKISTVVAFSKKCYANFQLLADPQKKLHSTSEWLLIARGPADWIQTDGMYNLLLSYSILQTPSCGHLSLHQSLECST